MRQKVPNQEESSSTQQETSFEVKFSSQKIVKLSSFLFSKFVKFHFIENPKIIVINVYWKLILELINRINF
jgi:hypothetical protein